jgi:FlaA1/EpsC-like NDP-sugar epimerase
LFPLKKKETYDSGEKHVKLAAYTIILYISSLFVPFVVVASYQSMVYYSKAQWYFTTPFSAYLAFMIAMLFIAIVLTVYLIFREKWKSSVIKAVFILMFIISISTFFLSLTNYYYVDENGIHYNGLYNLKQVDYQWDHVAALHIVYRNHEGTTSYYQYKFEMKNGSEVTLPFDDKLESNRLRIQQVVDTYKIPVKDNFKNPIVD